ncbi:Ig domain-containing protein [Enterococcus plantarum]|nr:Ig domain-containing protein [Enterococcus plantarum]
MAIGNGQYIHAPNEKEVVKINSTTYFKPSFAVRVIKKNTNNNANLVSYRTHLQDFGWGNYVQSGQTSGSVGKSKRLEGIQVKLDPSVSGNIQYKTHIQDIGWQGFKSNNALSGTTGKKKRLEAIQIKLSGAAATKYDVQYRVHSQDYGWQAWTKNGQSAGTQGLAKRLEAIEIKLVPKNTALPSGGKPAFIKK